MIWTSRWHAFDLRATLGEISVAGGLLVLACVLVVAVVKVVNERLR